MIAAHDSERAEVMTDMRKRGLSRSSRSAALLAARPSAGLGQHLLPELLLLLLTSADSPP